MPRATRTPTTRTPTINNVKSYDIETILHKAKHGLHGYPFDNRPRQMGNDATVRNLRYKLTEAGYRDTQFHVTDEEVWNLWMDTYFIEGDKEDNENLCLANIMALIRYRVATTSPRIGR